MYLLILSFDTINKLNLSFECGIPVPQDAGTPSFSLMHGFFQDVPQMSSTLPRLPRHLFFLNACIFRYYLSKPLTSLSCPLNAVYPCVKMQEQMQLQIFSLYIISFAVLENVPPRQGYRKEPLFHTKRRSGRDRESNPGHLLGRQRR
jgi:hypothetical protein